MRFHSQTGVPHAFLQAKLTCICAFVLVVATSCIDSEADPSLKAPSGARPALDARGGTSDNEVFNGARTSATGNSGDGGEIRLSSSGGNITVRSVALVATPVEPTFGAGGITVLSGETRQLQGDVPTAFLRVDAGGAVELTGSTLLRVTGDVQIDGLVNGTGAESAIDGKDLTIQAGGVVNILGHVNCSGFERDPDDTSPAQRGDFAGGSGGEIFISATGAIFISGSVLSEGGATFSTSSITALPGRGGQILIGCTSSLAVGGFVSVRGGFSYFTPDGNEASGGMIELVALNDIEMGLVQEFNASGGPASGATAGNGGEIFLEAAIGTLDVNGVRMECRGGETTFLTSGVGGNGGAVNMSASNVILSEVVCNASGGSSAFNQAGKGGDGGDVNVVGALGSTSDTEVVFLASGGNTNVPILSGGVGGNVRLINLAEDTPEALVFNGQASVQGGVNLVGGGADDGFICIAGGNQEAIDSVTGSNNFPIAGCGAQDVAEVVVHSLDCDLTTITPSTVATTLPSVLGLDFYLIVVPTGATTLTLSTAGEESGDIDLYAGPASALGSLVLTDYTFDTSTGDTSAESVTVDTIALGLVAGDVIAVLVNEGGVFVEDYSITLSGCP